MTAANTGAAHERAYAGPGAHDVTVTTAPCYAVPVAVRTAAVQIR